MVPAAVEVSMTGRVRTSYFHRVRGLEMYFEFMAGPSDLP